MSKNKEKYTETDHPLRDTIRKILLFHCVRPVVLFEWLFLALLLIVCLLAFAKLFGAPLALGALVLCLSILRIFI